MVAALFGIAILAAGFMLSWGAEAAEKRVSQGLIVAAIALVTVLPEYAVAGRDLRRLCLARQLSPRGGRRRGRRTWPRSRA
ncbi:hypothetical protein SPHINGOT1_620019 [Sphingomonas sp. T1]|nr:hypothetical protein SPHINGOT1_620019 [Sphingomonas sp. T1]